MLCQVDLGNPPLFQQPHQAQGCCKVGNKMDPLGSMKG
jgi:hypothetical protein